MSVGQISKGIFFGLRAWIKFSALAFFIIFLIVSAIIASVQSGSPLPFFKEIGNQFLHITGSLRDSLVSAATTGIYHRTPDFWTGIWNFINFNWKLFSIFYMAYVWIKILSWMFLYLVLGDNSKKTAAFILSILFFILLQMALTGGIVDTIQALRDIVYAIPDIIINTANSTNMGIENITKALDNPLIS